MNWIMKFPSMIRNIFLLISIIFGINSSIAQTECFPKKSRVKGFVYDEANVLTTAQENSLRVKLNQLDNSSSNQILVVTVPDLCGRDKNEYTTSLGHEWGIGGKEDNGIVIMVKPKEVDGKGSWYIAVGYGLEGVLNDGKAGEIGRDKMLPAFKAKDYYKGINAAIDVLVPIVRGEYSFENYSKAKKKKGNSMFYLLILFGIFFLLSRIFSARSYAQRNGLGLWEAFWIGNFLGGGFGGSSHRGGWDDFNSGGGGFGGFGGGGFGGGGAGGDW